MGVRHGHTVGRSASHEYACWSAMKGRCLNPRNDKYPRYGGAGVTVAERWLRFEYFLADMGPSPSLKHSLDRWPDNSGDYEPGNVRWATQKEQVANCRNRERMLANLKVSQRKGVQKSDSHRAALAGCQRGKPKAPWTPERRAAFSMMRRAAEQRKRDERL